jgi:hypothetical protein
LERSSITSIAGRVLEGTRRCQKSTLAAKDVEELRPTRVSLMPEGQLADLTAQEATDLIEYLHSLK